MAAPSQTDTILVQRIRAGDESAWSDLICRYEGRLLAFVESRIGRRGPSEDIVQETFVGFLNSLPNFDGRRALESYLFSICAYKLTDHLRREGRRPAIPMGSAESSGPWNLPGSSRPASSIARSGERKGIEEQAIAEGVKEQLDRWREKGEWVKLMCAELIFVAGCANKDVAEQLNISEQQVANYKFDFISRLKTTVERQKLSQDLFPELWQE